MSHNHSEHGHSHDVSHIKGTRLVFVIILNFIITAAQIIGGIFSGSLSLISDALHNFSDGASVIISYLALRISGKGNDARRTFGYKRATILAALINSSVLVVIAVYLFVESYQRLISPKSIDGLMVIWVAAIGLVADLISVLLLHKNSKADINLRSSYLHMLSDALSSVVVIVGGVLIYFFEVYWVDPLLTVLIGLYVLRSGFGIVKKAVNILMQGVPKNLDINEIVSELEKIEKVIKVHHVHIWSLDEHNVFFEAHVNIEDMPVSQTKEILDKMRQVLHSFNINHVTIQFEYDCCIGTDIIENCHC